MSTLFRIGMVLPQDPTCSTPWLHGWRLAAPPRAVESALGLSSATHPAHDLARALLRDYRAHALVGVLEPGQAARLAPELAEWHTPLLCTHDGRVRSGPPTPWVAHLTAQAWVSQWALGAWAAQNLGQTALLVVRPTPPDDAVVALVRGFEAFGGQVMATYRWLGPTTLTALHAEQASQPCDVVLAATLAEAVPALSTLGLAVAHAEPLAPAAGYPFSASWHWQWPLADNAVFTRAYQRTYGMPPTVWAVLGYEAGLRLAHSLAWGARTGAGLLTSWQSATPAGPRMLAWQPDYGEWTAPCYLHQPGQPETPLKWPVDRQNPALALWHTARG